MPDGDAARLQALTTRFSREDLLRAFDLLSKAEFDIRNSPHPRYHLEMALLKWIHLRQLVPLAEIIGAVERGGGRRLHPAPRAGAAAARDAQVVPSSLPLRPRSFEQAVAAEAGRSGRKVELDRRSARDAARAAAELGRTAPAAARPLRPRERSDRSAGRRCAGRSPVRRRPATLKERLLERIKAGKRVLLRDGGRAGPAHRVRRRRRCAFAFAVEPAAPDGADRAEPRVARADRGRRWPAGR